MNHLSRKKKLYGAGSKKPKVTPAVLLPPKIGNFQFGSSFSYVEILDLISDGPIEGLVDNNGDLLNESEISKGVYLDGTPISTSVEGDRNPESEFFLESDTSSSKTIDTFDNLNDVGGSFNERSSTVRVDTQTVTSKNIFTNSFSTLDTNVIEYNWPLWDELKKDYSSIGTAVKPFVSNYGGRLTRPYTDGVEPKYYSDFDGSEITSSSSKKFAVRNSDAIKELPDWIIEELGMEKAIFRGTLRVPLQFKAIVQYKDGFFPTCLSNGAAAIFPKLGNCAVGNWTPDEPYSCRNFTAGVEKRLTARMTTFQRELKRQGLIESADHGPGGLYHQYYPPSDSNNQGTSSTQDVCDTILVDMYFDVEFPVYLIDESLTEAKYYNPILVSVDRARDESISKITYNNFVESLDPVIREGAGGSRTFRDIIPATDFFEEDPTKGILVRNFGDLRWRGGLEMLWSNESTIANSDCFLCLTRYADKTMQNSLLRGGFTAAADTIFHAKLNPSDPLQIGGTQSSGVFFFQQILDKWATYADGGDDPNPFMRKFIERKMDKVFGDYVWKNSTADELFVEFFLSIPKPRWASGYMVAYVPDRDVLSTSTDSLRFNNPRQVSLIPTQENGVVSPVFRDPSYQDLLIPIFNTIEGGAGELQEDQPILGAAFIFVRNGYNRETAYEFAGQQDFNINSLITKLKQIKKLTLAQIEDTNPFGSKYNYNNVLLEFREGYEDQAPFHYFNKIHIDKSISKKVYGPFNQIGQVQRLRRNTRETKDNLDMDSAGYDGPNTDEATHIKLENGLPTNEGSNDNKRLNADSDSKDYASWNSLNNSYSVNERTSPITYYVNNPNVSEVFVTLEIDSLFDTVEQEYKDDKEDDSIFRAGDKLPAIMNIEIEVGKVLSDGRLQQTLTQTYRISALIEGKTLLDIGNPSSINDPQRFRYVRDFEDLSQNADLSTPFPLPKVNDYSSNNSYSSPEKRYVRVSKLSTETFSVLISKELTLSKVTEIIPVNLKYPFSAIVGTKMDSKSFSSIPSRAFDARLKLVLIPTNYFPTESFGRKRDKRYYDYASELESAPEENKSIYKGDWNGSFKIGWTDNPAWILYDLLTNTRYGLGRYLDEDDINKWELYKVGRFCDAVDSNGNFEGVPDGRGGLEPRYSCNILFNSDEKVFDSIQLISELFRGHTFFRASEVSFVDERIKSPVAIFNNNNVKDGAFNYSNLRRDQQFNTVEVSYLDRFENFTPKVEIVEDEEDIRSRGVFKNRVDGLGVTSRAMARRIGQHSIYRTIKENQRVAFASGLEALLCQPGDLILIDDDLKNEKSNFGKILSVDVDNQYIQLSGPYSEDSMTGILTVYNPTGESSISDLNDIANTKRSRTNTFNITGVPSASAFNIYTGLYNFSGYTDGYVDDNIELLNKFSEYAFYTGTGDNMLYFGTGYTGWTFATGLEESSRDFVAKSTGIHNLFELNTGIVVNYSGDATDKRGVLVEEDISGFFSGDLDGLNIGGILESEITQNSEPHIMTFNVTGNVNTGDGFSFASGVDKPDFLKFIKLGSPYRFDLKDASDILYKIDSIKENNPNEYLVSAAKFDTGKFSIIENNISLDKKENTHDYNVATTIGDITYSGLKAPANLSITTGLGNSFQPNTFFISGDWDEVAEKSSYECVLSLPNNFKSSESTLKESIKFDNLNSIGNYALSVKAIGSSSDTLKTTDSEFSTVRTFILYQDLEEFDRSFITNITFS